MSNLTATPKDETMTDQAELRATPLPLRNDTILGVCEAIGRDFGFHPNWLRLAFIAPLFYAPYLSVAAYFGLGLVVAVSHWIAPNPAAPAEPELVAGWPAISAEADEVLPIAA